MTDASSTSSKSPSTDLSSSPSPKEAILSQPSNYEAAMEELEAIVSDMESGKLTLQHAFEAYQRGFVLLQYCQSQLDNIESQVRVFDQGQLKPYPLSESQKSDMPE